ncbi:uncharacterized protein LOC119891366 [Micropterus salmoides]|uniref:uncharacterized protein LOC119891366 n=1 Tax=Micropterus salmoides TaxID=27706 RepID=UPI0018EC4D7D|nr:uncharacterized protein LOC119891366 [Micropterus salmoides]
MLAVVASVNIGDMKNKKGENLTNRLSNAERFHCTAPSANVDQYPELMDFLPKDYQYHICSYKVVNVGSDHMDFEATLRMSLKSKEDILVWLKSMPVTWRVDYTRPTKGSKIIFKTEYRCQHNTKPRATPKEGRASKNTDCPAKLKVTLARTEVSNGRQSRSTDPHIPDYPTLVDIVNVHNHNIHVADAVRHLDVSSKAVKQLTKFEAGQSPSSTLDALNYDLLVQLGNDYLDKHEADETLEAVRVSAQEWDSMSREFAAMVQSSERFQVAGSAFLRAFNRLKGNPSMMQAAMHMFGCYGAGSLASKRAGGLRRDAKHTGPSIATQPNSVARQKVKLVGRRRLITQKMTQNYLATVDHRYSYPGEVKSVSSCRGVSQKPKIMDAPPPLP